MHSAIFLLLGACAAVVSGVPTPSTGQVPPEKWVLGERVLSVILVNHYGSLSDAQKEDFQKCMGSQQQAWLDLISTSNPTPDLHKLDVLNDLAMTCLVRAGGRAIPSYTSQDVVSHLRSAETNEDRVNDSHASFILDDIGDRLRRTSSAVLNAMMVANRGSPSAPRPGFVPSTRAFTLRPVS